MSFLDDLKGDFDLVRARQVIKGLEDGLNARLFGMNNAVRRVIQTVILGEHCLLEGYPGLAKTQLIKTLASQLGLVFRRIQFVPDLMPSDLIHTERLEVVDNVSTVKWYPGPIFTNLLLADEINRASPKVQAALLEVTEERQASFLYRPPMRVRAWDIARGVSEYSLLRSSNGPRYFGEDPIPCESTDGQTFSVFATMNPVEQEGVFPLSEAQLDRFAFKVRLDFPNEHVLKKIANAFAFTEPPAESTMPESANVTSSKARTASAGPDDKDVDMRPTSQQEEHLKSLYFFRKLRRMLFGPEVGARWQQSKKASVLTERMCRLIQYTHVSPQSDDPFDASKSTALLDKLNASRDEHDLRLHAKIHRSNHPSIVNGSSPRGLLRMMRAAIVEAFMSRDEESVNELIVPEWHDVQQIAEDVLAHRIRLTPASMARGLDVRDLIRNLLEWQAPR